MVRKATAQEKRHMSSVAALGCIACRKLGHYDSPAELHHIKDKRGMGRRATHYEVIPLCYTHHRGAYGYHTSPKEFEGNYGTQKELLALTLKWLAVAGCACGCTKKKGKQADPFPPIYE